VDFETVTGFRGFREFRFLGRPTNKTRPRGKNSNELKLI